MLVVQIIVNSQNILTKYFFNSKTTIQHCKDFAYFADEQVQFQPVSLSFQ